MQILRASGHWASRAPSFALVFLISGAAAAALGQNLPGDVGKSPRADSPEACLGRGYADLESNRYEDAVVEFRAALALDPTLVLRARFPLAVALFESQKLDEARREFQAVQSVAGDRTDVMYYLGRMDMMQGNLDAAVRELGKAAASPPFPDTAYFLGSTYLRKGDRAAADRWLHAAERAAPTDPQVEERLAALFRQEGRTADAERALARAGDLRKRDGETDSERLACVQKLDSGGLDPARPVCERLFDPGDSARLTVLGTIYGQHGDFNEALKPLQRAAELSPRSPQMQYNLALVCFRLKRYQEAKTALEGAAQQWPDLFALNSLLGVVLYRLGDVAAAYQTLGHAHALDPGDAGNSAFLYEVSLALAASRAADKDYPAAIACLKTASELRPQEAEPHARMAEVYTAASRPEQAQAERERARQLQSLSN